MVGQRCEIPSGLGVQFGHCDKLPRSPSGRHRCQRMGRIDADCIELSLTPEGRGIYSQGISLDNRTTLEAGPLDTVRAHRLLQQRAPKTTRPSAAGGGPLTAGSAELRRSHVHRGGAGDRLLPGVAGRHRQKSRHWLPSLGGVGRLGDWPGSRPGAGRGVPRARFVVRRVGLHSSYAFLLSRLRSTVGSLAWRVVPPSDSRPRSAASPGHLWWRTAVCERQPVPRWRGPLPWACRRRSPGLARGRGRSRRCGSASR